MPAFQTRRQEPITRPHIILVEDDVALSQALTFALDLEGFDVRAHRSAGAVIPADMPAAGCLVIDYKLPGENGLSLLTRLRRSGVVLPAIVITSHANPFIRKQAHDLDASIVEKPLLGETLILAIREALGAAPPT